MSRTQLAPTTGHARKVVRHSDVNGRPTFSTTVTFPGHRGATVVPYAP